MQKLGPLLRAKGIPVELLPGIEQEAEMLQMQLAADEGPTIYAFANGEALAEERLEDLVQLFSAERGPAHRLLVLEVDADDPRTMVDAIVRARSAMQKHRSSGEIPQVRAKEPSGRRTQRGMPKASSVPRRPSPARREDSNVRRDRVGPIPANIKAPRGANVQRIPAAEVDARPGRDGDDRYAFGMELPPPADGVAPVEQRDAGARPIPVRDVIDFPTQEARPQPRRRVTPREIGPVIEKRPIGQDVRGQDVVPGTASDEAETAELRPRSEVAPANVAVAAGDVAEDEPTVEARRLTGKSAAVRRRTPVLLAAGGIAVIAAAAFFALGPSGDGAANAVRGATPRPATAQESEHAGAAVDGAGKPAHAGAPASAAAPGGDAAPSGAAAPSEDAAASEDTAPSEGAAASEDAAANAAAPGGDTVPSEDPAPREDAAPGEDAVPSEDTEAEAAPPAFTAEERLAEARRVAAALTAKKIHALDALLFFTPSPETPQSWAVANSRCRRATVNRVGQWRLPTVKESRKLRNARRLRTGRYWTTTKAGDDANWVVPSRGKPTAEPKTEEAQTVCVRRRIEG